MKLIFFKLILLIFPIILSSQNDKKLDSLLTAFDNQPEGIEKVKTSQKLYHAFKHKKPEEAFKHAKLGLALSKKINYKTGEGLGYLNLAYYYRFVPDLDSTRYYFKKSAKTLSDFDDKKNLWFALNEYAIFETIQGDFKTALKLADDGLKVATALKHGPHMVDNIQRKSTIYMDTGDFKLAMEEALNASRVLDTIKPENKVGKAIALGDIGRIEMLRGNYEEALHPLTESLEAFKKLNNVFWIATMYIELGNLYWYMDNLDKSLECYEASLVLSKKMNRDDFIASNLSNMAGIFSKRGNHKKALELLLETHEITKRIGSNNNLIISFNEIGDASYRSGDFNRAIHNHSEAIRLADSMGLIDLLEDGYRNRSKAYEKIGNLKGALDDQRQYQIFHDSIYNQNIAKQIDELKTQYETEKKEQQILLQKNEIDLLKQKGEIDNLYKILFGIGFLLSLIAFYAVRQKLKRSKIEREKLDLELDFKKKELTTHALHLAKKNEVLESLKQQAKAFKSSENSTKGFNQLIRTINFDLKDDNNWENFSKYFEEVHKDFNSNVKQQFPAVTPNELRLMALLKMNLSSKEIANILNISQEGIKKARYRLRKKLGITTEDSLQDLVLNL
ncbi:tetratricopeptide repeat protein [Sabulilitoribacter multivorans]|uniref:Tetratricopeptide repeat protein n=1 Tax=Flaviramulus multivorans TaxID=1304750 RepID=A0ABS9IHW7_9FLAO|nr:tetratricopeptide repeat protein [Flaviramulus multivorans]MCF7560235.1 tetratricopeptide repeat protein [Flaviramulus multivorans]